MYVSRFNYLVRISAAHFSLDSRAIAWLRIAHACIIRVCHAARYTSSRSHARNSTSDSARRPLARWMIRWWEIASLCSLSREIILHYGRVPREDALTQVAKSIRDGALETYRCQLFQFPSEYWRLLPLPLRQKTKLFLSDTTFRYSTNFSISEEEHGQLDACQAVKSSIFQTETSFSLFIIVCTFFYIPSSCNNSIQLD